MQYLPCLEPDPIELKCLISIPINNESGSQYTKMNKSGRQLTTVVIIPKLFLDQEFFISNSGRRDRPNVSLVRHLL